MKHKLYMLRHCKTTFNKENIMSGQSDCPLLEYIIDDSALKNQQFLEPYILICSPLNRCVCTGILLQQQLKVHFYTVIDHNLLERNMGIFEGNKRTDLVKTYPDYFLNGHYKELMTPPMGESFFSFKTRVNNFSFTLEKMMLKYNVIVCSHNQTLRMLTAILNGKNYTDIPNYLNGVVVKIF